MPDKFMVIDRVELLEKDGKIVGRTLYDSDANSQNIKKGQGGKLEKRWDELDEGIGRAIKLTMGSFKPPGKDESYPFVADFEWVENVFEKEAIQRTAEGPSGQERGLWWKELGMRLQDDETLKGTAEWVRLRMNYYAQMFSVLNLKIGEEDDKETKPDKVSTEQVRQLPVEESVGDRKGIGTAGELASRLLEHGRQFSPSWALRVLSEAWGAKLEKLVDIEAHSRTYEEAYKELEGRIKSG